MKKIILLALASIVSLMCYGQRQLGAITIDGDPLDDWLVANGSEFSTGTTYEFVVNFTGQETTDNEIQVKFLAGNFDDTADIFTAPITSADGVVTISVTPTAVNTGGILQVRSSTSTDFGPAGFTAAYTDNVFRDPVTVILGDTASVDSFTRGALTGYSYDAASDIVELDASVDYSVYNLAGSVVAEGSSATISLAGLVDGVYILATSAGTAKIIKY